jgi:hypothetical protein
VRRVVLGQWALFIKDPRGNRAAIAVARTPRGAQYLRSELDQEQPESLVALPDCTGNSPGAN